MTIPVNTCFKLGLRTQGMKRKLSLTCFEGAEATCVAQICELDANVNWKRIESPALVERQLHWR